MSRAPRTTASTTTVAIFVTVAALASLTACSTEPQLKIAGATTTSTPSTSSTVPESTAVTTTSPAQPTAPPNEISTNRAAYEPVESPVLDGAQTDTFIADGDIDDGRYWVVYHGSDGVTPFITLYVAYFGDACVTMAAEFDDECLNDIFVAPTPTRDLVDVPFSETAYVTVADVRTAESLLIDAAELVLASTGTPTAGAPDSFEYIPFSFIATIVDGEIIGFEQIWTP